MASGIYVIVNTKNGKVYVGQAQNFRRREREHRCDLNNNRHGNRHLQRAWNKDAPFFKFRKLEYVPIEQLDEREQHYIDIYRAKGIAYNIVGDVCHPMRGRKHSPETRRKMSEASKNMSPETRRKIGEAGKGRKHSPETRRKIGEASKNRSPETRRKISDARKGRKLSPEARRKIGEASKNMSPETRRKISDARKGKIASNETRQKISEAAKRRAPLSDESRRKISEARKGKRHSQETLLKLSEAAKFREARKRAERQNKEAIELHIEVLTNDATSKLLQALDSERK